MLFLFDCGGIETWVTWSHYKAPVSHVHLYGGRVVEFDRCNNFEYNWSLFTFQ